MNKLLYRALIVISCAFSTMTIARADVMAIWAHDPVDGDISKNFALYETARPIFEKLGATVEYYANDMNTLPGTSFVARFADMRAFGAFRDRLDSHPEFIEWNKRYGDNATRFETQNLLVNNIMYPDAPVTVNDGFTLFYYSAWKPLPGQGARLRKDVMQASAQIEELGGLVNVYQGGFDDMIHVFWSFGGWTNASQFMADLNKSKEWRTMWAGMEKNPSGTFVTQGYYSKVFPVDGD